MAVYPHPPKNKVNQIVDGNFVGNTQHVAIYSLAKTHKYSEIGLNCRYYKVLYFSQIVENFPIFYK